MTTIAAVSARPISVARKSFIGESEASTAPMSFIIHCVMNQKPTAEMTPATIRPR